MANILGLKNWNVLKRNHNSHDMVITAEYAVGPPACVRCGIVNPKLNKYGVQEQTFMDVPARGKPTCIKVMRQRFRCGECGKTFQQALADMDEKRTMTRRLASYIREQCVGRSFSDVAREVGVHEKTVRNVVRDSNFNISDLARSVPGQCPVRAGLSHAEKDLTGMGCDCTQDVEK